MNDLVCKITEEVIETEENFIFTTINPWCENVMQRKISKRDLERALVLYFNGDSILDKIRAEITNIHLTDTDGHNNNWYREPQAIINDALRIIDKYKAESEDNG